MSINPPPTRGRICMQPEARLRGRERELELVQTCVDRLAGGQARQLVIRAAAGLGKTSLLRRAHETARDAGVTVFYGRAEVSDHATPLAPLLDALASADDPAFDLDALQQLSGSPDQRFWVLRELEEQLARAALRKPLAVLIDDIQWADPATLKAIVALGKRLDHEPILWLVATRSAGMSPMAEATVQQLLADGARLIDLKPLDSDAADRVAEDVLGGVPAPALRVLLSRAEGNPFLLVEILRGLQDEELLATEDGEVVVVSNIIPQRLRESIGAQLRRLSDETRAAVEMAAALGRHFSVDELGELMERRPAWLLAPVREALDAGLFVEDGDRLMFRHDLVREAVDASIPAPVMRALRRRAMNAMLEHGAAASDLASLAVTVAEVGDRGSIQILRRASREIARTSPSVAAPLSARALELTPHDDPLFSEAAVETIGLLVEANQATDATRLMSEVARIPEFAAVSEAQARLSIVPLMMQYGAAEAVNQCSEALRLSPVPAALRVQMFSFMSASLDLMGEGAAAAEAAGNAVSEAATTGDPAAAVVTLLPQALVAFADGDWRRALELADEADRGQRIAAGYAPHLWLFDAWKCVLLLALGKVEQAAPLIELGSRKALGDGITANVRIWSMLRCRALLDQGNLGDARAEAEAVLAMSDEIGAGARGYINRVALYVATVCAAYDGEPPALESSRAGARDLISVADCRASRSLGAWMLALLNGADGGDGGSTRIDAEVVDPLVRGPILASEPRSYADQPRLVRLLLLNDQEEDAASVSERLGTFAARMPDFPSLAGAALHAHALVNEDFPGACEALELYEDEARPLLKAAVLSDIGRLAPPAHHREGVDSLDQALEIYTNAGAKLDAARVRRLLRDRGVRRGGPGSRSQSAWPELTESELAVVRLVAQGATNREVAEQLFLSPHTVNAHLRHVFVKLAIHSRVELARIAAERS